MEIDIVGEQTIWLIKYSIKETQFNRLEWEINRNGLMFVSIWLHFQR